MKSPAVRKASSAQHAVTRGSCSAASPARMDGECTDGGVDAASRARWFAVASRLADVGRAPTPIVTLGLRLHRRRRHASSRSHRVQQRLAIPDPARSPPCAGTGADPHSRQRHVWHRSARASRTHGREAPIVAGHEPAGEIVELGAGVLDLKVGDRVGVFWNQKGCGRCAVCQAGRPGAARRAELDAPRRRQLRADAGLGVGLRADSRGLSFEAGGADVLRRLHGR